MLLFGGIVLLVTDRLARPELDTVTLLGMAIVCAVLSFVSILLHELGHALWALREHWRVDRITLYGFGGIAWMGSGPYASPRAYFRVIAAGPLVTVALIVLLGATEQIGDTLRWPRSVVDVVGLLTFLQVVILLFNLAPAFPLDGGQMLSAWLWRRSGDPAAAVRVVMRTGPLIACIAVAAGMLLLVSGTLFVGLIVAIAGMEILFLASIVARAAHPSQHPRAEVVGDLIRERPLSFSAHSGVDDLFEQMASARGLGTRAFAVMREGKIVGYTSMGLARQVAEERDGSTVAEAMVRRDHALRLDPNIRLEEALEQMPDATDRAIVVEDGGVTGIVLRRAIADALLEAAEARRQGAELRGGPW